MSNLCPHCSKPVRLQTASFGLQGFVCPNCNEKGVITPTGIHVEHGAPKLMNQGQSTRTAIESRARGGNTATQQKLALDPGRQAVKVQIDSHNEHWHQSQLFERVRFFEHRYEELLYVAAVPNGGFQTKATAGKAWAEGRRSGVPDVMIMKPVGLRPGAFIELKVGSNKPSEDQVRWLKWLVDQGYWVMLSYDWADAWAGVQIYLGLDIESPDDHTFHEKTRIMCR